MIQNSRGRERHLINDVARLMRNKRKLRKGWWVPSGTRVLISVVACQKTDSAWKMKTAKLIHEKRRRIVIFGRMLWWKGTHCDSALWKIPLVTHRQTLQRLSWPKPEQTNQSASRNRLRYFGSWLKSIPQTFKIARVSHDCCHILQLIKSRSCYFLGIRHFEENLCSLFAKACCDTFC